ncbi:hypothetical protein K458DRAFT_45057 [Lentithecium fluviatile CBS 122367]|uniref:Uncharacterized protein n=1 Tax=Lentithecium fluviatile CBS 122367 TaxID=1168545 RepID=A0A6G1IYK4_9PLEO|nr:hypothetical protein K458DRAFT_45057 [Lentithecium fluviatile CBS 122367]
MRWCCRSPVAVGERRRRQVPWSRGGFSAVVRLAAVCRRRCVPATRPRPRLGGSQQQTRRTAGLPSRLGPDAGGAPMSSCCRARYTNTQVHMRRNHCDGHGRTWASRSPIAVGPEPPGLSEAPHPVIPRPQCSSARHPHPQSHPHPRPLDARRRGRLAHWALWVAQWIRSAVSPRMPCRSQCIPWHARCIRQIRPAPWRLIHR